MKQPAWVDTLDWVEGSQLSPYHGFVSHMMKPQFSSPLLQTKIVFAERLCTRGLTPLLPIDLGSEADMLHVDLLWSCRLRVGSGYSPAAIPHPETGLFWWCTTTATRSVCHPGELNLPRYGANQMFASLASFCRQNQILSRLENRTWGDGRHLLTSLISFRAMVRQLINVQPLFVSAPGNMNLSWSLSLLGR